jgi:hypothetical protein
VGRSHLVEVLLQLRRSDWDWYHANEQDIQDELMELMEQSVIPRMFGDEIEQYHAKRNPDLDLFPPEKGVGSKNTRKTNASTTTASTANNSNKRKGRKGSKKPAGQQPVAEETKPDKDLYFSFGEAIQLAYRKQPLQQGKTVLYNNNQGDHEHGFTDLPKLPNRLLIWCSKIDPQSKTNPDPSGVGFYRPEMIPIASLFREPIEETDD